MRAVGLEALRAVISVLVRFFHWQILHHQSVFFQRIRRRT